MLSWYVGGLTLDHADYARRNEKPINWETRLNIALGSARGLNYLHHDCIPHIIHRDIKASNILLDEDMEAHVSDFGLAKLINPLETHVTTIMAGTLGYFPPGKSRQYCFCSVDCIDMHMVPFKVAFLFQSKLGFSRWKDFVS